MLLNVYEDRHIHNDELHTCFVDLEKAFDSVEHWAIAQALKLLGFSDDFIEFVNNLNSDLYCDVITTHGTTNSFPATRGVRQGCSFSPLLFIVFMEPLLKWVLLDDTGYKLHNHPDITIPILAFADDLVVTANNYNNFTQILAKIQQYFDYYGVIIGKKSAYTYASPTNTTYPTPILSNNEIELIDKNSPYKYLGINLSISLN